jgi:hypothetical protein
MIIATFLKTWAEQQQKVNNFELSNFNNVRLKYKFLTE